VQQNSGAAPQPLLTVLRAATPEQHAALDESGLALCALATPEKFAAVIGMLWGVHAQIERDFERMPGFEEYGFSLLARRKTPFLVRDARELQERGYEVVLTTPQTTHPFAGDLARAIGCLYVIEYSTLGGVVLHNALQEQLGFTSAYFGCYGSETMKHWKSFQAALQRYADAHPAEEAQVVEGVRATFDAMRERYEAIL
jgi:heme oxygenase